MNAISRLLLGGSLDHEVLRGAQRSTLMRVDDPLRQYSSFFLRLLAATVVATAGIASDSATTIIGAMLIAPLMSPMLGCALATAMGRPRAALRTLALVAGGMALVVVVSIGVTALIPVAADMETNSQVLARTSPRLVDLVIALAAGFMAALASMRADIPDAVPGVAISASIVPPLCVVGERVRQIWYALVALAMAIVIGFLMTTSANVLSDTARERQVQDAAAAWLDGTAYRVVELTLDEKDIYLRIAGDGPVPDARDLNDDLLADGVEVESLSLSVLDEQRIVDEG